MDPDALKTEEQRQKDRAATVRSRSRQRKAENPYVTAAAQRATQDRYGLESDKGMRLASHYLHRRVAYTAEVRGMSVDSLPGWFAHVDTCADDARRAGMTAEAFKDAYIRDNDLAPPRPRYRAQGTGAVSVEEEVARVSSSQTQAQESYGYGMPAPERGPIAPLPPHQPERLYGRGQPVPDPQLPPIHAYMPARAAFTHQPSAHTPAGSRAPAPYTYAPPTAWRPQGPPQGRGGPKRSLRG